MTTPRFFRFDIGVRHAAAGLQPSTVTVQALPGPIFEQWVGIELWKQLQYRGRGTLHYFRTKDGAEVDFVIADGKRIIPIEVKWTERPTAADARHLRGFLDDHKTHARHGYIVCRCSRPQQIDDRVTAIPWTCL